MVSKTSLVSFGMLTKVALRGKVIAIWNSRSVYSITSDMKEQITTLCAANGDIIPPMHIFTDEKFKSCPMQGCVDGAYFGRSPNGWISTELFYGWLAKHFAKRVTERLLVLLVDGHSSHIDLEVCVKILQRPPETSLLPPTSHVTHHPTSQCRLLWCIEDRMGKGM